MLSGKNPLREKNFSDMRGLRSFLDGRPCVRAERELGYRPEVSIDEAIGRALEWFRAQGMVQLDGKLAKAI
jgi:nucleoside-diphosphate-sugar epimerase